MWKFDGVLLTAFSMSRSSRAFRDDLSSVRERLDVQSHHIKRQIFGELANWSHSDLGDQEFWRDSRIDEWNPKEFKPALHIFEAALMSTMSAVHQYLKVDQSMLTIEEQKQKEYEFIHLVSDIHGELAMIQSVLDQQKQVLDDLLADSKEEREDEKRIHFVSGGRKSYEREDP